MAEQNKQNNRNTNRKKNVQRNNKNGLKRRKTGVVNVHWFKIDRLPIQWIIKSIYTHFILTILCSVETVFCLWFVFHRKAAECWFLNWNWFVLMCLYSYVYGAVQLARSCRCNGPTQNCWFTEQGIENGKLFATSLNQVLIMGACIVVGSVRNTHIKFIVMFCIWPMLLIQLKCWALGVAWRFNDLDFFSLLWILNRVRCAHAHTTCICDKNGNTHLNGNNINLTTITIRWLNTLKRSNLQIPIHCM